MVPGVVYATQNPQHQVYTHPFEVQVRGIHPTQDETA